MQTEIANTPSGLIPENAGEAEVRLEAVQIPLNGLPSLSKAEFLRGWNALFYLHAGLHPDESDNSEGGWPEDLLPLAREAWRRLEKGEISEEELYCSDASWAGLCDQITNPTEEEHAYRQKLAAE